MKRRSFSLRRDDRILFIRLSAIGDVINAIPGLVALRQAYPDNFIAWCVEDLSADLLRGHPYLDEVLVVEKAWRKNPFGPEARAFFKRIRRMGFTVAIDAHGLLKSGLISWLSGAGIRIGQNLPNIEGHRLFLNTIVGPRYRGPGPAAVRRAQFLKHLGADLSELHYTLPPMDDERTKIEALLTQAGIGPDDLTVVLNPCASRLTKQWPGEYFVALGRRLAEDHGARIIWTGSPKERPYVGKLAQEAGGLGLNLAGELNLRQLAALLAQTRMMVTGDTGPMHLGAAVGIFVVALMGSTDPGIHGPFTEHRLILTAGMDCQYCCAKKCSRGVECMRRLLPEDVAGHIGRLLVEGTVP